MKNFLKHIRKEKHLKTPSLSDVQLHSTPLQEHKTENEGKYTAKWGASA